LAAGIGWWIGSGRGTLRGKMSFESTTRPLLAPLQQVMLRDSLAAGDAGHHVEQLEIVLADGVARGRVAGAWAETVVRCEALRVAFLTGDGVPLSHEFVAPSIFLNQTEPLPECWECWRDADRRRPLLAAQQVPWRAVYWPEQGRFIWTFHHALLDGRSITRILRDFLARVAGGNPEPLAIAEWRAPSAESLALAAQIFRADAADLEPADLDLPLDEAGPALRCLGNDFALRLESVAAAMKVTAATVLTWAWGQALMEMAGGDTVRVEQLRAGAPQPGTAGFTMNTLPLMIRRSGADVAQSLREFRAQLLALRAIESVTRRDFAPGVFPDMDGPSTSVIMIERGTLRHLAGGEQVESLVLHEAKGETLLATAYLLPDLRLEVEGPGRGVLLAAWIRVLEGVLLKCVE
jgi:hypothetical protein